MHASPETVDWLRSFYAKLDALRFEEVAALLHDDCRCVFPGGQVVVGRERIVSLMSGALGALERIRHQLKHVWQHDQVVIFELEVTYWRRDGREIVRPGMGVFVVDHGKVREQRLFVDASGVWD